MNEGRRQRQAEVRTRVKRDPRKRPIEEQRRPTHFSSLAYLLEVLGTAGVGVAFAHDHQHFSGLVLVQQGNVYVCVYMCVCITYI